MTDRYTKAVLTVIAIVLSIIAFREAVPQRLRWAMDAGHS